jgi:hypothetical protein
MYFCVSRFAVGSFPFFRYHADKIAGISICTKSTFLRREWMALFCSSCVETRFAWMSVMPVDLSPKCLKPVRAFETHSRFPISSIMSRISSQVEVVRKAAD